MINENNKREVLKDLSKRLRDKLIALDKEITKIPDNNKDTNVGLRFNLNIICGDIVRFGKLIKKSIP
jgi:hypothetical protein